MRRGNAAVLCEHAEEVLRQLVELEVLAERGHRLGEIGAGDLRIADEAGELLRFAQRRVQLVEVGFDRRDGTRLAGEIEQGRGVAP